MQDWKSIIKNIAPVLGTALGGTIGAAATKIIADKLLGNQDASEDEIVHAIDKGISSDVYLKLKEADQAFLLEIERIGADKEKAYFSDIQSARASNSGAPGVFMMGCIILSTFALIVCVALYGSFELMTGGIQAKDAGVVATVSGLIGSVIGYVAANAQQVVGFYFGSSSGSDKKTDALSDAIKKFH